MALNLTRINKGVGTIPLRSQVSFFICFPTSLSFARLLSTKTWPSQSLEFITILPRHLTMLTWLSIRDCHILC
ncbi:hypothetical protein CICLE_v10033254mg [Citrus x clementina]|uniref:Uncharacterized protein n=1 Tax=Citrus clementina TaxID=85681 RepID=V4SVL1_CITCL|nr:hypothetical protein CICLE_v10033254mg [Citrus x clementina]